MIFCKASPFITKLGIVTCVVCSATVGAALVMPGVLSCTHVYRTGAWGTGGLESAQHLKMYDRGHAASRTQDETKIVLLERAAQLGHPGAARGLEVEQENMNR